MSDSDEEVDVKQHNKLLENLISLDCKQPVKKPTRTEPTTQISEFNLVKSITGNKDTVKLYELTKPLKARSTHVKITKEVKKSDKKTKTLKKPLEKPQADRVRRTVGYEKGKEEISRWEPVVTSHRAATYLSFPLNYNTKVEINSKRNSDWKIKSDLEKAIEKIDETDSKIEIEDEIEAPLTLNEMMERRKEMVKLRRFQTYQEMKARMQNKIKSKKYRRVLRKERAKREIKDFEKLQKENPEEALRKLEEIEKMRVVERASLRHKSTGKWAKNQQIRARFDKNSREVLAEQLAISKELTEKKKIDSESENDEENDGENIIDGNGDLEFNFWGNKNVSDNKNELLEIKNELLEINNDKSETNNDVLETNNDLLDKKNLIGVKKRLQKKIKIKNKKNNPIKIVGMSGDWIDESFIEDLSNKLEDKVKEKVLKKSTKIKNDLEKINNQKPKKNNLKKITTDLTLKKTIKTPIINEPLYEAPNKTQESSINKINDLKLILDSSESIKTNSIQPNNYLKLPSQQIESSQPDLHSTNNSLNLKIISEAFEDEDLIDDFSKDKQRDIEKDTPKDLDLFMPGWGSWGGTKIKNSTKRKRFIMKFPKNLPRNDNNRGDLIVNENVSGNVKKYLVSDVPFPFKSSGDFEAMVKAPIGNTFVPETAFRRLTKPGVTTKLGAVIEPVDEEVLMRKMRKFEKVFKLKK